MNFLIGYLQYFPEKGNPEKNIEKVEGLLKDKEFDILVLPELAFSGYFYIKPEEILPYADEGFRSRPAQFLKELSMRKNALILCGFPEKAGAKLYNSQYAFLPSGEIVVYRKSHLFYKEKLVFAPGDTGPVIVEHKGAKIGMMVCFDWFFPEFSRVLALKGVHLFALSANLVLPGLGQKGMFIRSVENRVFSIVANRTGFEKASDGESLRFTGMSQIVSPKGEILAQSGEGDEEVKIVEVDLKEAENKNVTALNNVFNDRRIDLYGDILNG